MPRDAAATSPPPASASAAASLDAVVATPHFIADPETVVRSSTDGARSIIQLLDSQIKYRRVLEQRLVQRQESLRAKLQELDEALTAVQLLRDHGDEHAPQLPPVLQARFEVCEGVYVKARIGRQPHRTVHLWLGAKAMVEFTLDEAVVLLEKNRATADTSQAEVEKNMAQVRTEMVTAEVNLSRLHNAGIRLRQQASAAAASGSAAAPESSG